MSIAEFAYAQARLQARHGRGPDTAAWQLLEASHTAAHYVAQARSGPLAWWVEGLDEARDAHHVERHVQARWLRLVTEVAGWLPPRWAPATQWFGTLAGLSLGDAARRGQQAATEWLETWRASLPRAAGDRALLQRPAELLLPRLVQPDRQRRSAVAAERRELLKLFRRHAGSAVAVFAYLALVALDVERLRGGMVVRVLFETAPEAHEA
jgi:hypothetical protein